MMLYLDSGIVLFGHMLSLVLSVKNEAKANFVIEDGSFWDSNAPKIYDVTPHQDLRARLIVNDTKHRSIVEPEVLVVLDYKTTRRLLQNETAIKDYIDVYFRGINLRYATINNPQIQYRLASVYAVYSRKNQSYLERSRVGSMGCDISKVLDKFSSWIYQNLAVLPSHDIAHLITGEEMLSKDDSSNSWTTNINGLAHIGGACWVSHVLKKSIATSVVQDSLGVWNGVFTSAHELAHNIGAVHDGAAGNNNCSQKDGYLMSYSGWGGSNKFYFSRCSINDMHNFIKSSRGKCLSNTSPTYTSHSTFEPDKVQAPGERLTMTQLCKYYTSNSLAIVNPGTPASTLCKHLICRYPDNNSGYYILRTNHPPGDLSSCGNSTEKCINGDCVSHPPSYLQRTT